jgi:hypothetical protein
MKRALAFFLFTALLVYAPAAWCESGAENSGALAFVRLDSGQTLTLGMRRIDAEAVLGEPIEDENALFLTAYPGGMHAAYRDGAVCALMLSTENAEQVAYALPGGVGLGASFEQAGKPYEPYIVKETDENWYAFFERTNRVWKAIDLEDYRARTDEAKLNRCAGLNFFANGTGSVDCIFIVDAHFAMYFE